jgi:hypothetical protein
MKLQDTGLSGLRRRYYISTNKVLRGSEADRKLDMFLTPADATLPEGEHTNRILIRIDLQKHWCSWQGMRAKCLGVNRIGDSYLGL